MWVHSHASMRTHLVSETERAHPVGLRGFKYSRLLAASAPGVTNFQPAHHPSPPLPSPLRGIQQPRRALATRLPTARSVAAPRKEGRKEGRMSRSSSAMDVFNDVLFVRLRSITREGKYMAADVDGVKVVLSGQRNVYNTVWAVDPTPAPPGHGPCVLLRSAAYGRYLFATNRRAGLGLGKSVEQVDKEQIEPPPGMLWNVARRGGDFVVRTVTGRYLRANGKHLKFRREVTTTSAPMGENTSPMMLWAIEPVPAVTNPPGMLQDPRQLTHKNRALPTEAQVSRQIRYLQPQEDGSIDEEEWTTIEISNNNLLQLRYNLANRHGPVYLCAGFGLCIRAGRYGRLTPILIDLPIGNNKMDIVVVAVGSTADNDLRYPNVTAP
ncbi:hypothetical protein EJB05_34330, partial [Eragrostis curvula]